MDFSWVWICVWVAVILSADCGLATMIPFLSMLKGSKKQPLSPGGQCSMELWSLERQIRQTVHPFKVKGHWVSSDCETRPGPNFVLRDYHFYETGSFMLRQYIYEDPVCSKPKMAFIAHGRLRHMTRSWLVSGASESSYELHRVSVVPYTKYAGRKITHKLRKHCRPEKHKEFAWPLLEQYRQLQIFKKYYHPEPLTLDPGTEFVNNAEETDEIDCTHALNYTVSELELLRMEERQLPGTSFFVKEFFLGLPVWDPAADAIKMPAQFQTPLRNADEIVDCRTCEKVKESNQLSPPIIRPAKKSFKLEQLEHPEFPLYQLDGNWLSTECESHSNGMFVHRQMTFAVHTLTWELRQRHYNDPMCRHPSYTLEAHGEFSQMDPFLPLPDTWKVLYKTTRVQLVPESRLTARNLRHATDCGPSHQWRKGKTVDVTSYGGCLPLGIQVPAVTKDILKLSDDDSNPVLYTGDTAESASNFPTFFRAPMRKCEEMTVVVSLEGRDSVPDGRGSYQMWKTNSCPDVRFCSSLIFCTLLILVFSAKTASGL